MQSLIAADKAGDPTAIRSLIQWLKDMNWPGAGDAVDYLETVEGRALPEVREILQTPDYDWKYAVVTYLIAYWPLNVQERVASILKKFAESPPECTYGPIIAASAAEILCKSKLLPQDELNRLVNTVLSNNPHLPQDEVEDLKAYIV